MMTEQEALTLAKGSHIVSPHTFPPYEPITVRAIIPSQVTGRLFIQTSATGMAWLPASEYDLPPKGATWHAYHPEQRGVKRPGWWKGGKRILPVMESTVETEASG